jgi:hypothetical protein
MTSTHNMTPEDTPTPRESFDLDALLHPAKAFVHPSQVVHDPDLTRNEKRAILASWASDVCAVEAAPDLRTAPGGPAVRFDDILDALRTLDRDDDDNRRWRKTVRRRQVFDRLRSGRGFGLS